MSVFLYIDSDIACNFYLGTHYLSSTFLGSKIATVNVFTSYERLKHGRKKISQCAR